MSNRACAIILMGMIAAAPSAGAATFTRVVSAEGITTIILHGDIEPGDAETLESLIKTADVDSHSFWRLRLDSPGGSLIGGISLAQLIHRHGDIATLVGHGSTCASACFLAFAAGREKFADSNSLIGVHGVADKDGRVTERTAAATQVMARVSEELGVPATINEKIISTPPYEIVWLTPDDLKSMGATMVGRPVQALRGMPREPVAPKREPAVEAMNLSQMRNPAVQIREALDAAERADYATAIRLWRLLAEQGNATAQYNLGQMYYAGQGVAQDFGEAFKWYRRAAEQGLPGAQLSLGVAYALGRGVQPDLPKAYKWLALATDGYASEQDRAQALKARALIAARMTPNEVAEAEKQSHDWTNAH